MTESLGTARIDIVVGTEQLNASIQQAQTRISGLSNAAQADFAKMSAAQKRVTETALKNADTFGKTKQEVLLYNAALKGLPTSILEELKSKLLSASAAAKATGTNLKEVTFKDSQLFAANKALNEFKGKLEAASTAAKQASNDFQKATFNPAQIYAANKALTDYKNKLAETTSAAKVSAVEQGRIAAGLARENGVRERLAALLNSERGQRLQVAQATNQHAVALGKATLEFNRFGVSAKQQAAALRGVPAQLTDIFTSLASGQRPITVLLQQGGQLKDMFGGVVPAARALGGAILGLVNPFTVAAGAALGLFLAWKQGDDESVAFRQALALTGNAAGVTADQMQAMALSLSQGIPTQHEAAAALAEVAKSGKFTGEQLREVAEAALAMQKATGQSIEQTVGQFAKLRDDPVKAVTELNETYHFLTLQTYEQIKALQAQGREEEALSVAIKAASGALTERANDVVANAGYMERAWRGLGAVVRQVWDDMRNAGRASTVVTDSQIKIESARSGLNAIARNLRGQVERGQIINPADLAANKAAIATFKKQIADAQKALADDPAAKAARQSASKARANELAISLKQQADTYLDGAEKLKALRVKKEGEIAEAVKKAREVGDKSLEAAAKASGDKILGAIDKQIADAEQRAAKAGAGAGRPTGGGGRSRTTATSAQRSLPELDSKAAQAELERLAQAEAQATESFKDFEAQLQGPMAVALRDHEKRVAELNALAAQSPEASARLSAALELEAKRHAEVAAEIEAQSNPLKLLLEDMRFELDLIGKSNAERAVMVELRRQNIDAMSAEGQAALVTAKTFEEEAKAKQRSIELMDEFRGGASDALADIVTGAKSAKEAFADFFDDLARRITQMIAEKWIERAFGNFGTTGEGSSGGGLLASFFGMLANEKGNVFSGGNVQAFANGGVVNGPTFFPMNSRLGLMGEAGPEAIVPLKRGPDGRLGIESHGNSEPRRVMRSGDTYIQVQGAPNKQTLKQLERANGRGARREMARTGG